VQHKRLGAMLRNLILTAAIVIGGCQAEPEPPRVWAVEREYDTDCLPIMGSDFQHEGIAYTSRGWGEDNHFTALNLVTGECTRAGDLSVGSHFRPVAASAEYLFAWAGQYYMRYSLFERPTGQRVGTVALRSRVRDAVLHDGHLYALQDDDNTPYLSVFTLPDLHFVEERSIAAPYMRSSAPLDDGFLISWDRDERVHVAVIDFTGRIVRHAVFRTVEPAPSRRCDASANRLGDDAVLIRTDCGAYAVLDLATLAVRYTLRLDSGDGISLADAFVADGTLYLVDEHYIDRNQPPRFVAAMFDYATGERIGALPPLTAEHVYRAQVGDRLIWASRNYRTGAHVQVFDLRRRPSR
jgi:hypothetical protein